MQKKDISESLKEQSFYNYCFKRDNDDVIFWEKYLADHPEDRQHIENQKLAFILLANESAQQEVDYQFALLKQRISSLPKKRWFQLFPIKWVAAASVLIIAYSGYHYYTAYQGQQLARQHANTISPGGNKAILILPNGKEINLTNAGLGDVAMNGKSRVVKTEDGSISFLSPDKLAPEQLQLSTIQTPNGGQYQVELPDGSKAWLNSASSITFPVSFAKNKRIVSVTGEVYFEVVHRKDQPFSVSSKDQIIDDLGTAFLINAYDDETPMRTTLVSGEIRVTAPASTIVAEKRGVFLKPGEQTSITKGIPGFQKEKVNVKDLLAWKEGYFRFRDEKIENIMRQLSRWYNIEVDYNGRISDERFNLKISRDKNIRQILGLLTATKVVQFKIEGRRVTVSTNH